MSCIFYNRICYAESYFKPRGCFCFSHTNKNILFCCDSVVLFFKIKVNCILNFTSFSGYRIYYVDGNYKNSSRLVLDHETYILNLTEANHDLKSPDNPEQNPKWSLLYRATEAYGLSSLFPSDYNTLLRTFINDDRTFQKFWYLRHKGHVSESCKEACKTTMLCFLRSGRSDELDECDHLNGFAGNLARAARKTLC